VFFVAFAELIWLDVCRYFGFRILRRSVARTRVAASRPAYDALDLVRLAVRDACVLYPKPVHCLQRSAVVTRMLRRRGIDAQLVIGCQPRPLTSHAWVEVGTEIVWDRVILMEHYQVMDRV
jgi:hypothetical protein